MSPAFVCDDHNRLCFWRSGLSREIPDCKTARMDRDVAGATPCYNAIGANTLCGSTTLNGQPAVDLSGQNAGQQHGKGCHGKSRAQAHDHEANHVMAEVGGPLAGGNSTASNIATLDLAGSIFAILAAAKMRLRHGAICYYVFRSEWSGDRGPHWTE